MIYVINFFFLLFFSGLMFLFSLKFLLGDLVYLIDWEIISYQSSSILMIFLFDWMSFLFMSFVLFISSLVIYYSKYYMEGDNNETRFIYLVVLFVFSMMMLIISPNLISILLGWDGLGLVSYCLVIYFQNSKSYNAGMITALTNRIGDVALLLSIAWMMNFGSWTFYYYLEMGIDSLEMVIISSLVLLAALTKSAQIPFSSWLPAAMAAPTPVSALVHSSTLVTAGVYLLIRFFNYLNGMFLVFILLLIGSLTMFMSGLGANFEMDLKKIIALSTLSQLGLMMGILSFGFYKLTFFHLLTHALFKALLFLCAGLLIHSMLNFQDIRWSGGFLNQMPMTLMSFNISNLALCGMPFLAGFYSKDMILEILLMNQFNLFIFFFFFFSTGLTVSYTFRLMFFSVVKSISGFSVMNMNDEGWGMLKMLFILTFFSVFGGSLLGWLIFPFPLLVVLPFSMKMLTLLVCILGGLFGYFIFSTKKNKFLSFGQVKMKLMMFFSLMWFMPYFLTIGINKIILNQGYTYMKCVDFGWNEVYGGGNLIKLFNDYSLYFMKFHYNNFYKNYFLVLIIIIMMIYFLF